MRLAHCHEAEAVEKEAVEIEAVGCSCHNFDLMTFCYDFPPQLFRRRRRCSPPGAGELWGALVRGAEYDHA